MWSRKSKETVDKELEVYRREREIMIDRDTLEREQRAFSDLHVKRKTILDELFTLEHEYHNGAEKKRTELVKLDTEILYKKDIIANAEKLKADNDVIRAQSATYKATAEAQQVVISSQKETIALLNDLVKVVVGRLPKVELDKLNLNINSEVKSVK